MNVLLAAVLASCAAASEPAPAAPAAPAAAPTAGATVTMIKDRFIEAVETPAKNKALEQLAKTAPASGSDVAGLFDLFSRFPDPAVRKAVMDSLALLTPDRPQLEPLFINYLKQPEAEAQLYGINGAFRLKARSALPLIRSIAARKFESASLSDATMLSERHAWWTQYEALSVLAQWEPEAAYSNTKRRAEESPAVGRLLGRFYWKKTLPELKSWSASANPLTRERAAQAASAAIEPADARATRDEMLKLLRDTKADAELRHQIALKVGMSSTDEEAEQLVAEHDAQKTDAERLYWAAAAFASRSPKAVPLLARYAANSADEVMSKGAENQLVDMVGAAEAAKLVEAQKAPKK